MKNIFFALFLIAGCSSHKTTPPESTESVKKVVEATKTELPKLQDNIDMEMQEKLQGIWKQYFVEEFNDSRAVNVLVVTNRNLKSKNFGCTDDNFGIVSDQTFRVGVCRVNVPRNHGTGELKLTRDQRESSHDYFKILGNKEMTIETLVDYLKKSKRSPLIFIHGFNVKHEQAVIRASQIAYDLKYQGPVVLFSWPAGAGDSFFEEKMLKKTYELNYKSAQTSVLVFKNFISKLIEAQVTPNILVHSMGHQVVLPALFELGKEKSVMPLGEVILNAPDFESELFVKNIDMLKNISKRVTLYCSYNDKAMFASETVNSSKRLGACFYMEGIDTVNVSLLDNPTFGLGHGYYASRPILTDVFQVLLGIEADRRLFMRKSDPNSTEKYYLRP
jgi:esterase/lipase superfamily enzyme